MTQTIETMSTEELAGELQEAVNKFNLLAKYLAEEREMVIKIDYMPIETECYHLDWGHPAKMEIPSIKVTSIHKPVRLQVVKPEEES